MKKPLSVILTALAGVILVVTGLVTVLRQDNGTSPRLTTDGIARAQSLPVIYANTEYGFSFSLPTGWSGYTILNDQWMSNPPSDKRAQMTERGPLITIRHPRWTQKAPRQDIPIMIFTTKQWNGFADGKFYIGAAPIAPRELGRNEKYVFTIPARYNFAFPIGYEQVNDIIDSKPLCTF